MKEMISITVNADTVTDYTGEYREEILRRDLGARVDVEFPREIVERFCMERYGWTVDDLIRNEYDSTDTDGLYQFSIDNGFHPVPPMPEIGTKEFDRWF